ncbi:hypothetical protein HBH61_187190 [Parastagonospora nodorum]|nr:hypothetical protein HBH61_187190 [Parastagonospora nodorum]
MIWAAVTILVNHTWYTFSELWTHGRQEIGRGASVCRSMCKRCRQKRWRSFIAMTHGDAAANDTGCDNSSDWYLVAPCVFILQSDGKM